MEFDNDRPVKRPYRIETGYWILLALMNPLVNCITVFWNDLTIWWLPFAVNFLLLPAYLLFSVVLVPRFLFTKKYGPFFISSLLFLTAVQLLLYAVYALVLRFSLPAPTQAYFTYSYSTLIRESLWSIIYTAIAAGVWFIKKALDEGELLQTLEQDNAFFRLRYLRAQLSPHFLFNTLNSIYSLSLQQSGKTPDMVIKLADLMRYLIYECNEATVPLDKEIEFIRNYIDIEKIRYQADIRFIVEGDTEGIMIEPFLFIAFVENGFKHAFDTAYSNAFIYITIKAGPEQIELSVVNNTGIDIETQAKKAEGSGIRNSKSILDLLYPSAHALHIIQTEKEEARKSGLRLRNAKKRLESLYPDAHTLDVILNNNAFTVSLIIKSALLDKVHHSGR